ncbi:anhydro-N-acetylmuramic acid kinase [Elizabethkingia anophelis]|uniref:anhydro-N-acetylmuramic acid kinase n=1 Tax=Elizabethkingia anophelis TaxID=1117645 RepID=UPI00053111B8|nr:anhydro-N-acetylmuramic acid kinase [Elizabethkingia anophelis]AQW95786.1 anhydro-N-acetylmuramic acid kinase [Elizabethkingia anophelis]KGT09842.1 anhydro-N-acetylmuramic acid kinase [Elizabethkingia anophelis]MCT4285598.1 anhydro-N-acetylmuramic acid kinase [Elizabethkingia anophelis]MDV3547754.1 anhydro-N-acetylmuramic acid kinase [Elizabethkingia anophelis]MDV3563450.1 anhydro-N-acetylmuramic acid kinase [Elizabethkingia anophelis]
MKNYHCIGLMSGTSLDGLDICYVQFTKNPQWDFRILKSDTVPYSSEWQEKLRSAVNLSSEGLLALHSEYGFYLAECTQKFIREHKIEKLDVIASHGHTVFHQPQRHFTLQIGDARAIKYITSKTTVYDFRSQDVLMGGNGAPLVPIGDHLLFSKYSACLNLGGFTNISYDEAGKRIAFDISPLNVVLNTLSNKLGQEYDQNGDIARSTAIDEALLQKLNALSFYKQPAPKSLGIEWVNTEIIPLLQDVSVETALATLTRHSAEQVAAILNQKQFKNILVTGGGVYNHFFIESLQALTSTQLIIPNQQTIEFKEALIFAFMGLLRILGENNVLASATGAAKDHSSGIIA